MFKELVEKRNELKAKQDALALVFQEGKTTENGNTLDLAKVKCLGADLNTVAKAEKIKAMNDELTAIGKEVDQLAEVEQADAALRRSQATKGLQHPEPTDTRQQPNGERKSLGTRFIESDAYKSVKQAEGRPTGQVFKAELKTLMERTAGFNPEVTRTGVVIEDAQRPIQLTDIMPTETTTQQAVKYMEETTFTNNAAEKAEGVAYPEGALAFTERTVTVEKIAVFLPVTDEQLEDEPRVESLVNNRLGFMLRQRLDGQISGGDGATPNLRGFLNVVNIQTQAKGADPTPDAIRKAITKVRVTGRALPNIVALHPNDWQDIRLLRTVDGIYIWGSPSEAGPERIWGLQVVQADSLTEGTGAVADFANFSAKVMRRDVDVQIGYIGDNFKEGKKSIRADMRLALVWYRPEAIATITGI